MATGIENGVFYYVCISEKINACISGCILTGQKFSFYSATVILPYYKKGNLEDPKGKPETDIVFRRHVVDRMPIDCWNDVWQKLHEQIVNVDVLNVNSVSAEVYSTVSIAVIWLMRFALSVALYLWIDKMMRPIYAKYIPCDLGRPTKEVRKPLKKQALGSLGKSR